MFPFFATESEVIDLWQWLAEIPDVRFCEEGSKPNLPLRYLDRSNFEEMRKSSTYRSPVGWPANIQSSPSERWVEFEPNAQFRLSPAGFTKFTCPTGIRILQTGAPPQNVIAPFEMVYETPFSAKGRFSDLEISETDWSAFNRFIATIKKRIEKTAAGKWRSMPVLPEVAAILRDDGKRLWFWGHYGTL